MARAKARKDWREWFVPRINRLMSEGHTTLISLRGALAAGVRDDATGRTMKTTGLGRKNSTEKLKYYLELAGYQVGEYGDVTGNVAAPGAPKVTHNVTVTPRVPTPPVPPTVPDIPPARTSGFKRLVVK